MLIDSCNRFFFNLFYSLCFLYTVFIWQFLKKNSSPNNYTKQINYKKKIKIDNDIIILTYKVIYI